jgi:DNA-binding transcriptional LysR family regulator
VLAHYLAQYPEVNAQAWFVDRVVNLVEEGVDVAVRIGPLPDSSLQAIKVGEVRRVVCAAPAYLGAHAAPAHPDDLHDHVLISSSAINVGQEWRFEAAGQAHVAKIAPRLVTNTNDAALAAAVTGLGITRLMSYQCAEALRSGRLHRLLTDFEPPPVPVHLVHREGRHPSRKVRAFLDLATEGLRALDALR